jgi:23S rRNA-/tRNA-specific pseudouridylate synthase
MKFPMRGDVRVLRAKDGLVALLKPAGVLSHPNSSSPDKRAILTCAYDLEAERYDWDKGSAWLLHRLDSATSGVLLFAEDEILAKTVKKAFQTRAVQKSYRALVFGAPRAKSDTWTDSLRMENRGGVKRAVDNRHAIQTGAPSSAVTQMELLQSSRDGVSLLGLEPQTGKMHQLRVQCARRKLPIVGDGTYGDFKWNREFARITGYKRLFLHALSLEVAVDHNGERLEFRAEAPLPPEFNGFF